MGGLADRCFSTVYKRKLYKHCIASEKPRSEHPPICKHLARKVALPGLVKLFKNAATFQEHL